jgi:hypothetical protein
MRGETTFSGDQKKAQREAFEFILDIAIRAKRNHSLFDAARILFDRIKSNSNSDFGSLLCSSQQIFVLLYSTTARYTDCHKSDQVICCWSTVISFESESKLAGTITWYSTKQSGAFVRIVFGARTTFAIYDTGYITDEFGQITERGQSPLLGLPRKGDSASDMDQASFLSYALSVSQDPKWQG